MKRPDEAVFIQTLREGGGAAAASTAAAPTAAAPTAAAPTAPRNPLGPHGRFRSWLGKREREREEIGSLVVQKASERERDESLAHGSESAASAPRIGARERTLAAGQ